MLRENLVSGRKSKLGQCLIEVMIGSMLLIPIALLGVDLSAIVLANSANDSLVKSAARAAANQGNRQEAERAAADCVAGFRTSELILNVRMSGDFAYDASHTVLVKTIMTVKLPVGLKGFETVKFEAQAVEPVLAAPADV